MFIRKISVLLDESPIKPFLGVSLFLSIMINFTCWVYNSTVPQIDLFLWVTFFAALFWILLFGVMIWYIFQNMPEVRSLKKSLLLAEQGIASNKVNNLISSLETNSDDIKIEAVKISQYLFKEWCLGWSEHALIGAMNQELGKNSTYRFEEITFKPQGSEKEWHSQLRISHLENTGWETITVPLVRI